MSSSLRAARGCAPGAERKAARRLDRVDYAGHQRILGTDDDEIGIDFGRELTHRDGIGRDDRETLAELRHARIAGRAHDVVDQWRARKAPCERVLTPRRTR